MRRWARTWRCEKLAAVFFPGSLERPGRLAGRLRFIRAGGYTFQIPQRFPGDLPHHRIRVRLSFISSAAHVLIGP